MDIQTPVQAEQVVQETLFSGSPHQFIVEKQKTQKRIFGWVVFYNTKQFLETRNPSHLVPGVGPVIVLRDGQVIPVSTSLPPAQGIAAFEENWRLRHGLPLR